MRPGAKRRDHNERYGDVGSLVSSFNEARRERRDQPLGNSTLLPIADSLQ